MLDSKLNNHLVLMYLYLLVINLLCWTNLKYILNKYIYIYILILIIYINNFIYIYIYILILIIYINNFIYIYI